MPRILAIDTATRIGSVAWASPAGTETRALSGARDHGRTLARLVSELVGDALGTVDAFAISIGPGSFTGLRVGLAFLKGVALVYDRPVIAISTLEALAHQAGGGPTLAVLDARGGEVFAGLFGVEPSPVPEGVYATQALAALPLPAGCQLIGEPPAELLIALGALRTVQSAEVAASVATLAASRLALGVPAITLRPSYGQPARVDRHESGVDTLKPGP